MKFIKGARTWRSILGTQTFFWPLTHTPPPWYSINQPLSKGLDGAPQMIEGACRQFCLQFSLPSCGHHQLLRQQAVGNRNDRNACRFG